MTQRICNVDDCTRTAKSRGWCGTHYERWRVHGAIDDPPRPDPVCQVDHCDQPTKARGWCKYHWQRWSRYGDPVQGGGTHRARATDECVVDGCDRRDSAHGWCKAHYYRWRRYGDPLAGTPPMPQEPRPEDWLPTYGAAHWRVAKANGPASEYACIDCEGLAEHWSYDHDDAAELVDTTTGLAYSLDIEHYNPRCVSCHRKFDLAHGQA